MKRRVVITGMGALTPIGNDVSTMWESIQNQVCGISEITKFDTTDYKVKLAGEISQIDFDKYFDQRELKFNDDFTKYARVASKQAMFDADIMDSNVDVEKFGVLISSGIGGIKALEQAQSTLLDRGPSRVSPYFIPMTLINLAAGSVAIDVGAKGYCSSTVTACAAGTNAIGEAFHRIRDGYEDLMLSGGSEASITPLAIAGFQAMRALHTENDKDRASIPFDKKRSGFVMGEGAGILLLEELSHAQARGAKIYAEIVGYGASCDAFHITAPIEDGSGGSLAMKKALADAQLAASKIDYINAHGTSTQLNDKIETLAIKNVFGEKAYSIPVSSTKSNTGHLLGASGAVEAIITIKGLQDSYIPPTINYKLLDSDCDLDIVANTGRFQTMTYAMSNSLGFGGHNASIIFKKWED